MNEYRNKMMQLRQQALGQYKNANGPVYRRAEGGVMSQALDPNDRTLTVDINPIDSTVGGTAIIFGANLYPDETQNTANNMTVVIPESSHKAVKYQSLGNPFRVKGLLYTCSSVAQLAKPITIINSSVAGALNQRTFQPTKYTAPTNYTNLQIKTSDFQVVVDGQTRFEIVFVAGATAQMILSISDKVDIAQTLSAKSPIKSA